MTVIFPKSYSNKQTKLTRKQGTASVEEIERSLGLDQVEPIVLTSSEAGEFNKDNEYFKEMYEGELGELFKKM